MQPFVNFTLILAEGEVYNLSNPADLGGD